jgi:hypothetical protein
MHEHLLKAVAVVSGSMVKARLISPSSYYDMLDISNTCMIKRIGSGTVALTIYRKTIQQGLRRVEVVPHVEELG